MAVFWCAGMYASGSTWAYNIMRALAAEPAHAVRAGFANTAADLAGLADATPTHVIKSHDLPEDAAELLLAHAPRVVATIRDPRDAVASLMTYQRYRFETALAMVARSARFATTLAERTGALLLRYETGFPDDPATVARIAAALGLERDPGTCAAVFAGFRRDAVERFIRELDTAPQAERDTRSGDVFDPETQWHRHHAGRTGEVGRWRRTLMLGQPAAVDQALADWMERHGYERSSGYASGYSGGYTMTIGNYSFGRR